MSRGALLGNNLLGNNLLGDKRPLGNKRLLGESAARPGRVSGRR